MTVLTSSAWRQGPNQSLQRLDDPDFAPVRLGVVMAYQSMVLTMANGGGFETTESVFKGLQAGGLQVEMTGGDCRAPRIISSLQGRCGHEKAAEEAAQQENLISTLVEIV